MDFNFQELHKASIMLCEVDHSLQKALQLYGDEYKRMKADVVKLLKENEQLKEELAKLSATGDV